MSLAQAPREPAASEGDLPTPHWDAHECDGDTPPTGDNTALRIPVAALRPHEACAMVPEMTDAEYADLLADVRAHGVLVPIDALPDGRVLDGRHRLRAARECGLDEVPVTTRNLGEIAAVEHIARTALLRRNLTAGQKAAVVLSSGELLGRLRADVAAAANRKRSEAAHAASAKQLRGGAGRFSAKLGEEAPGPTTPRTAPTRSLDPIARVAGVSARTVQDVLAVKNNDPALFAMVLAGKVSAKNAAREVRMRGIGAVDAGNKHRAHSPYIEAARAVMGGIDLDPASSNEANAVVGAKWFYMATDEALRLPWFGRLWLNPPSAWPQVAAFCTRLAACIDDGSVTQACVLVNNSSETAWFQLLAGRASSVSFPRGGGHFSAPNTTSATTQQGQAILYFGDRTAAFAHRFRVFGVVMMGCGSIATSDMDG